MASTMISLEFDVRKFRGHLANLAQEQPVAEDEVVGLVDRRHFLTALFWASSKDRRAIRLLAWAVILRTESAMSSVGMNSPQPAYMLRSG